MVRVRDVSNIYRSAITADAEHYYFPFIDRNYRGFYKGSRIGAFHFIFELRDLSYNSSFGGFSPVLHRPFMLPTTVAI